MPGFAWENDPAWLRSLLVPDPLPSTEFEAALTGWQLAETAAVPHPSLAAWLLDRCAIAPLTYLQLLQVATGLPAVAIPCWSAQEQLAPAAQILHARGYRFFRGSDGQEWICGDHLPCAAAHPQHPLHGYQWAVTLPRDYPGGSAAPSAAACPVAVAAPASPESAGDCRDPDRQLRAWIATQTLHGRPDLHLDLSHDQMQVRSRGSHGLEVIARLGGDAARAAVRRIKHLARLSTAANALPQDGCFRIETAAGLVHVRVACLPTVDGESLVLRLLGGNRVFTLADLHLPADTLARLQDFVHHGSGLLLCVGPTGSGKSTTLTTLLRAYHQPHRKLLTIEDPIEVEIPHATQSNVDPVFGWSFEAALKAFLRQDPDQIMVGEIRDAASARLACRAALTGHTVFATLHADSPAGAVDRLREWSIPAGVLADTLRVIVHQRLLDDPLSGRRFPRYQMWFGAAPEIMAYLAGSCDDLCAASPEPPAGAVARSAQKP